jgi:hypothetical protein
MYIFYKNWHTDIPTGHWPAQVDSTGFRAHGLGQLDHTQATGFVRIKKANVSAQQFYYWDKNYKYSRDKSYEHSRDKSYKMIN